MVYILFHPLTITFSKYSTLYSRVRSQTMMEYLSLADALANFDIFPPANPLPDETAANDDLPEKISAYYSLAFPNFTYYVQTITVSIGRRSVRQDVASSSTDASQVDIDLGPLKNVSRLHARIEYDEAQERFILVVLGRNGAWVDGVWSGSGSRVPLGPRWVLPFLS